MPKKVTKSVFKRTRILKKGSEKTPIFNLTKEELYNIVISLFVIALLFAYNPIVPSATLGALPRTLFAVSVALLLHIAAQKIMAARLGCVAFYRLWLPGLIVSMLLMVVGINPIILVGAVSLSAYKFGRIGFKSRQMTMTEIGWIGVAGPLVNIILLILFNVLASSMIAYSSLLSYMAVVNGLIAFFTLLPIKPLDGSKVMLWDPIIWVFLIFTLLLILTPSGLINYFTSPYIG
jgi:Zn-dependent protease